MKNPVLTRTIAMLAFLLTASPGFAEAAEIRIYVGNLPYTTTAEDLENMFLAYGDVTSVEVPVEPTTGRNKGFGFVKMPWAEDAHTAIEALNGIEFRGRPLAVRESREQPAH